MYGGRLLYVRTIPQPIYLGFGPKWRSGRAGLTLLTPSFALKMASWVSSVIGIQGAFQTAGRPGTACQRGECVVGPAVGLHIVVIDESEACGNVSELLKVIVRSCAYRVHRAQAAMDGLVEQRLERGIAWSFSAMVWGSTHPK